MNLFLASGFASSLPNSLVVLKEYADEYLDSLGTVFDNMREQGIAEYKTAEDFGSYFERVATELLTEFQEA